ncbi:MAG: cobalamin-dependent protein [Candidatus Omnitrophica bacterium]|nr:cobalamin-dependent protein [Candidatus Omnitrophota bacterium]
MRNGLLLHVPKNRHYLYPFRTVSFISYMPIGLISIAAYASDNGFPTKIINLGLEKVLDKNYDIADDIKNEHTRIIGISLHWHHSAYDVIETAKYIKSRFNDVFIVLGGYTASFFWQEIMEEYKCVDGVIKGDGEVPWLELLRQVEKDGDLSVVPNLAWRGNGMIGLNQCSFIVKEKFFNSCAYTRFHLVKNYRYLPGILFVFFAQRQSLNKMILERRFKTQFFLPVSRGCTSDCGFCGGACITQRMIANRDGFIKLSPRTLFLHTQKAVRFGYTHIHFLFCSYVKEEYILEILNEFKKNKFKPKMIFEFLKALPHDRFLSEFVKVFDPESRILLAVHTFDKKYRRKY